MKIEKLIEKIIYWQRVRKLIVQMENIFLLKEEDAQEELCATDAIIHNIGHSLNQELLKYRKLRTN